jgi:membrane protein implicated in regulation of membrane protease activity
MKTLVVVAILAATLVAAIVVSVLTQELQYVSIGMPIFALLYFIIGRFTKKISNDGYGEVRYKFKGKTLEELYKEMEEYCIRYDLPASSECKMRIAEKLYNDKVAVHKAEKTNVKDVVLAFVVMVAIVAVIIFSTEYPLFRYSVLCILLVGLLIFGFFLFRFLYREKKRSKDSIDEFAGKDFEAVYDDLDAYCKEINIQLPVEEKISSAKDICRDMVKKVAAEAEKEGKDD